VIALDPKPPRKSSRHITLVLLGAAALAACGDDVETRDVYASRTDCVQDWGDEQKCEPVRDGRYHSSYFYGPRYTHGGGWGWSGTPSSTPARAGSHAIASSHISRGGFGHSASAHASGGG
jgi:uncharacterized protein YgiB involved in biofilm formation